MKSLGLLICSFLSFQCLAEVYTGRISYETDYSKNTIRVIINMTEEFNMFPRIAKVYLENIEVESSSPEGYDPDSVTLKQTQMKLYRNDLVELEASGIYEDGFRYIIRDASRLTVKVRSPRIQCHSQLMADNKILYLNIGSSGTERIEDPEHFLRIDSCLADKPGGCSHTWATGDFYLSQSLLPDSLKTEILLEKDVYEFFHLRGFFIREYSSEEYWKYYFDAGKPIVKLRLFSHTPYDSLKTQPRIGALYIKEYVLKNSDPSQNNTVLTWSAVLGPMKVEGEEKLECYRWN